MRRPDAVRILASEGAEMVLSSPKDAMVLRASALERWAKTVKSANVKAED